MKINYKVTTLVLVVLILVTYVWNWQDIFYHNSSWMYDKNNNASMGSMHQMPNGSMMGDRGGGMMGMSMTDMVDMMNGKTGKALEKEFLLGMIPHHQGAVDMAKKLLADPTVSNELKNFANQIIIAQESEIKMMQEWLKNY
jgi:uncharacterized protein (DUF305 family)